MFTVKITNLWYLLSSTDHNYSFNTLALIISHGQGKLLTSKFILPLRTINKYLLMADNN
ncbi:hypothetical protein [Candidatus Fukatsuia anoeciicola]|uniref:hypothetical protein n=1 Tax=Candidatus Fukatsuia anoeciicola TaxID=2994492 RepID=UPI003463E61B